MDDDLRRWLFDPTTAHRLVLARRPHPRSAVACVVSDVVWHDVVRLLRWAAACTQGRTALDSGRWWRLAASCADLLRRLPGLADELGEGWDSEPVGDPWPEPGDPEAASRVEQIAGRLAALLRSGDPVSLQVLAVHIDALGAAAIGALAEQSSWTLPGVRA
jgi:hypothetical protein